MRPRRRAAAIASRPLLSGAVVLERPELRREHARRRLEQRRQVDVIGAEAHAVLAQRRARRLVERSSRRRRPCRARARRAPRRAGRRCRARGRSRPRRRRAGTAAPSSFSIWALSQRSSRACTLSRGAPVSCSSAMMRTRGLSTSSPATSLPTGCAQPADRRRRSPARTGRRGACASWSARASISPASAFCAAPAQRLGLGAGGRRVGREAEAVEPADMWPSTMTSPVLLISASSMVFSLRRRISTLVRRSTKRSVSRSCSASDSLSSTARVTPCQCSGSASQSGRLATKVQVRIWAMRFDSVSMSPSVAVGVLDLAGEPVGRDRAARASGSRRASSTSSACVAGEILR